MQQAIKKNIKTFYSLITLFFIYGCATDPLTYTLRNYKYSPIVPISKTQHIGDMYTTTDLTLQPKILMRDIFSKEELEDLMESIKGEVSLLNDSGERRFRISAEADVVGYATPELSSYGISKFKVHFKGTYQYILSQYKFLKEIYPKILERMPKEFFLDGYIITALLQVNSLEYEFYDTKGKKFNIKSIGRIEKILKAKLGHDFYITENSTLFINEPRFVGYRIAKISNNIQPYSRGGVYSIIGSYGLNLALSEVALQLPLPPQSNINFEEVSDKILRKSLVKTQQERLILNNFFHK